MSLVTREERSNGVVILTLDRPRANAFSPELVADLSDAVSACDGACAIVFASSQKIFSGGWDLTIVSSLPRSEMSRFLDAYTDLIRRIFTHERPVIAALSGHAIAGGLIFAAAADERIAAEGEARLGLSEVALAVPIPRPLYEVFRFVLGDRGAERLAAAGENLPVDRAAAIGLVDEIVAAGELLDRSVERAYVLGERPRPAHAEIKRRARAEALRRFDASREGDPFLDFWFEPAARGRVAALVEKLRSR
ncbi:MAG TPA: enoyl-CoA hydratase/isomerase family protein [Thermoanaerobaculia bacterium]